MISLDLSLFPTGAFSGGILGDLKGFPKIWGSQVNVWSVEHYSLPWTQLRRAVPKNKRVIRKVAEGPKERWWSTTNSQQGEEEGLAVGVSGLGTKNLKIQVPEDVMPSMGVGAMSPGGEGILMASVIHVLEVIVWVYPPSSTSVTSSSPVVAAAAAAAADAAAAVRPSTPSTATPTQTSTNTSHSPSNMVPLSESESSPAKSSELWKALVLEIPILVLSRGHNFNKQAVPYVPRFGTRLYDEYKRREEDALDYKIRELEAEIKVIEQGAVFVQKRPILNKKASTVPISPSSSASSSSSSSSSGSLSVNEIEHQRNPDSQSLNNPDLTFSGSQWIVTYPFWTTDPSEMCLTTNEIVEISYTTPDGWAYAIKKECEINKTDTPTPPPTPTTTTASKATQGFIPMHHLAVLTTTTTTTSPGLSSSPASISALSLPTTASTDLSILTSSLSSKINPTDDWRRLCIHELRFRARYELMVSHKPDVPMGGVQVPTSGMCGSCLVDF
jgi:hypothetical protein